MLAVLPNIHHLPLPLSKCCASQGIDASSWPLISLSNHGSPMPFVNGWFRMAGVSLYGSMRHGKMFARFSVLLNVNREHSALVSTGSPLAAMKKLTQQLANTREVRQRKIPES